MRDGFVGIVQLLSERELRVAMRLAVGGDVFGDCPAQRGFIDLQMENLLIKLESIEKSSISTPSRVRLSAQLTPGNGW